MPDWLILTIFIILLLSGIVGVILPMLPGIPYMFVIALIFAVIDKFQHLTGLNLLILVLIAGLSLVVDYFSGILGARFGGASKRAILFGLISLIIGLIAFPPWGGIIGLFLGVLVAEISLGQKHLQAFKAAGGSLLGALTGIIINLILSLAFLVLFIVFAVK